MKTMIDNDILRCLRSRRSTRHFSEKQVSDGELEAILTAGTYAPTGHGTQAPWIVAVQNPDIIRRLRYLNAQAMGENASQIVVKAAAGEFDPYYGAPTIILVFAPEGNANSVKDGSLILGNMMNAAHSLGVGSCWINREDAMFKTEEGKALLNGFSLPEDDLIGVGALALGYPSRPPRQALERKDGYYRIIR